MPAEQSLSEPVISRTGQPPSFWGRCAVLATFVRAPFLPGAKLSAAVPVCAVWLAIICWLAFSDTGLAETGRALGAAEPASRVGTAAGPFGWAIGIGDFDRDGTLDLAVADRLARRGSRTDYALEIRLSGGSAQTLAFSSAEPELNVAVADVDADGDLDITLAPVLARGVVAVWLNDGQGRFTQQVRVGVGEPVPTLPRSHARYAASQKGESEVSFSGSRRAVHGPSLIAGFLPPPRSISRALSTRDLDLPSAPSLSSVCRAPPPFAPIS